MPLPMVHLAVANLLVEKIDIHDLAGFFLGSISPDAVHMRANYVRDDKGVSHLMTDVDKEQWLIDAIEFTKKGILADDAFAIGYGVHCITDDIWGKTLYHEYRQKYSADEAPLQDEVRAYYNDTDKLDFELFEKYQPRSAIWELMKNADAVDVLGLVTKEEVEKWKIRTLHWYDSGVSTHENPIKYILYDDVMRFVQDAANKICRFLCE